MTDPHRLRRDGKDFERALLGSSCHDAPTEEQRQRAFAALGISLAGASGAPSTPATKVAGGAGGSTVAKGAIVAGLAVVAVVSGIVVAAWPPSGVPPPPGRRAASVAVATPTATATVAEAPAVDVGSLPEAPLATRSAVAAPRAEHASPADAEAPLGLTAEIALLDEVRAALAKNDPARALSLLDQHARGHGSLVHEAVALQVEALSAAGDAPAAARTARAFLAEHPKSPLAPRIRTLANIDEREESP